MFATHTQQRNIYVTRLTKMQWLWRTWSRSNYQQQSLLGQAWPLRQWLKSHISYFLIFLILMSACHQFVRNSRRHLSLVFLMRHPSDKSLSSLWEKWLLKKRSKPVLSTPSCVSHSSIFHMKLFGWLRSSSRANSSLSVQPVVNDILRH